MNAHTTGRCTIELDEVIGWVNSDQPKTPAQLRQAAAVLDRYRGTREPGVAEARVRVAVTLERLGE
ncbi:hypothetical protein ACI78V_11125 [Geodermatophilus sp. SYSU D00742]